MNFDLLMLLIFAIALALLMYVKRQKVKVEKILFPVVYMILYRTKLGLKLMDKLGRKHERFVRIFGVVGIVLGFVGMIFILVVLSFGIWKFLFANGPAPVGLLLPGVKTAPGLPVLSFWHWIIAIFILAGVHEFNHGLLSRAWRVKVKSSGFAVFSIFLPLIPAAFVEPDEEELVKSGKKAQLSVFAAGSYANFITAALSLVLFLFILTPVTSGMIESHGVMVIGTVDNYPANISEIKAGEEILKVNDDEIKDLTGFFESLKDIEAGDDVELETNETVYSLVAVKHPEDGRGYLGINVNEVSHNYVEGKEVIGSVFAWLTLLIFWVFTANLGVGLFNVLPMLWPLPLDGGKMFYLFALKLFKDDENKAKKLTSFVSLLCLILILVSLSPLIIKFFNFVFQPFFALLI